MNKKTTISTIAILTGVLGFAGFVLAASNFSISLPQGNKYDPGDTFTASISVSPSEKIYTVGIQLDYPANLLEVQSFTFGSTWMPLSQEGYDSIDNTNGLLIKTAGYPGGITSAKTIGTVTFKAKNSGQGAIQLTSDTFALNAQNVDVKGNLASLQVDIGTVETVVEETTEEVIPEETVEETTPEEETIEEEAIEEAVQEETIQEEETVTEEDQEEIDKKDTGLLAAIISIPFNLKVLLGLVIVVAIGLLTLWIIRKKKSKA